MVVNGRFIGRSLVCLLAFGLGLLASDQKCFEQSGDKTILKGDCKGSEVLVVKSQQLKVHFKSSLIESKPEFHLTFGGFEIAGTYLSTHDQAIIQLGGYPYNLPLTMTIMPDNILVKNKKIQRKLDGSSKFEQDGKTYTIKVNYDPLQPQELGSLPITFDATIFVEKEDTTAKIILAAIASLVILVVIIILLVVICFCVLLLLSNQPQTFQRANNKKLKMSKQPPQSTPAAVLISSEPKLPHAYDSPVQPIVNPVKKKEEPVVKDKKLDEEKEFNLIVGVVLLAVAVSAFDVGTNDTNSLFIHGTKRQRSAAELKEYHQRKRAEAVKMHKNYEVTFPEDPVSTFVFIGESEKAFIVAIESGSDDFWILDVSYPNPGSYATVYDPFNFTSVELGDFYAESANLRLEGKKYADNVTFGNPINQTFGSVTNIYGEWNDPQFYDDISGSFGLSWNPALKDEPVTADSAPILNVFASLDPCPRVFGQLTSQFPENGTMAGSLTVFGVNLNHWCHPSPVAALPLSYDEESKQMTFKLDSFAFGSQKIEGDLAKVDTGSSAIYLPWEAFEIIFASLVPTFDYEIGVYTIDCNDRGHLDDFVFTVAGAELRVSSTSYVFDLGLEDNQCVLGIFYSSIASSTSYSLGVPFLYEYAVEWSIDDSTITFKNYLPFPTAAPKVDARI